MSVPSETTKTHCPYYAFQCGMTVTSTTAELAQLVATRAPKTKTIPLAAAS
jgi:hypothetical protein